MKSIVIDFNFFGDIQRLMYAYQDELTYCEHMLEKLKSNSYKTDNSSEILEYSLKANDLRITIKKLEEIDC